MPTFQPKRHEQILQRMVARVVARTELSDLTDSSVFKHILAAAAREDDDQYYQMTLLLKLFSIDKAEGEDLDERAKDVQPDGLERLAASLATGTVVFSRAVTTGTVQIREGTQVKTADGVVFLTTEVAEITPTSAEQIAGHGVGRDSAPTPVIAAEAGTAGNVAIAAIIRFGTKPAGVEEVTNLVAFTGGADEETDDAFRARIKAHIQGLARSTPGALESAALGVTLATGQQVRSASVIEDLVQRGEVTLYIDDGTGGVETTEDVIGENVTLGLLGPPPDSAVGGEEFLYLDNAPVKPGSPLTLTSSVRGALVESTDYLINRADSQIKFTPVLVTGEAITAGYTHFTGLIQAVQSVIDGDPNDRDNFPGYRAAGVRVTVLAPTVLQQVVTATLGVAEDFSRPTATAQAETVISQYINGLSIGADVVRAELIERIMGVSGVIDVVLGLPSGNVPIGDDELARVTDANITVT